MEVNGEWQTFPDAVAADEALNAEPMPEAAGNFHITDDNLGVGGPKQKFARNIEAIQTLPLWSRSIAVPPPRAAGAFAVCSWGGLSDVFDPNKENWSAEYTQLKGLLTEEGSMPPARASTLNAHYTSPMIIRGIYDAVEKRGLPVWKYLGPSPGMGNFFRNAPGQQNRPWW